MFVSSVVSEKAVLILRSFFIVFQWTWLSFFFFHKWTFCGKNAYIMFLEFSVAGDSVKVFVFAKNCLKTFQKLMIQYLHSSKNFSMFLIYNICSVKKFLSKITQNMILIKVTPFLNTAFLQFPVK